MKPRRRPRRCSLGHARPPRTARPHARQAAGCCGSRQGRNADQGRVPQGGRETVQGRRSGQRRHPGRQGIAFPRRPVPAAPVAIARPPTRAAVASPGRVRAVGYGPRGVAAKSRCQIFPPGLPKGTETSLPGGPKLVAPARGKFLRKPPGERVRMASSPPRRLGARHAAFGVALGAGLLARPVGAAAQTVLPEIVVVAPSPLQGAGIDRDKVPAMVQTLTADDFQRTYSPSVTETLLQRIPGVVTNDVQGNSAVQDLRYRGFVASPLAGTPQGLAVYLNGVRVNESFGDTVNWDLIPTNAIDRADMWTNNPVFGLNALGGAVSIQMKNGFT